jgi:hypothetical protein
VQNRVTTGATLEHPNAGFNNVSQQNFAPAFTISGQGRTESPFGVASSPVIQPHERHGFKRTIRPPYRMASGASRTMPADTAFKRVPPKQIARPAPKAQQFVLPAVRARRLASFSSRNNVWQDPNQSFLQGKPNLNGDVGRGRWATVKRGAAG